MRAQQHDDGVLVVYRDVSERERAAAELADVHAALREHAAALERSNRELAEFASIASHDLPFRPGLTGLPDPAIRLVACDVGGRRC